MKTTILTLGICLVSGLSTLGAQEQARERARRALPPEVFQGVEALVGEMAPEGIPGEPLFNKALEGMAKGVPAPQLLPAVNMYANRLRVARGAFGEGAEMALVVAGADALQRGVEAEALGRLMERGGAGGEGGFRLSPMAVLVLADLVESGVSTDHALGVLGEAIRQRTGDQAMLGLTGRVRQLMRQGRSPQEAAEQIRRALQAGRGGGGMTPPVPPGSEPATSGRKRKMGGKGGG